MKIIFRLTEPTTYTRQYETASWYTKIEVPAGDYEAEPIYISGGAAPYEDAYYFKVVLPGVVTDDYFVNRLLGHSAVSTRSDVGKPMNHVMCPYGYSVRGIVENGDRWGLPGEWIAVQ
jgi:hypothetical protein